MQHYGLILHAPRNPICSCYMTINAWQKFCGHCIQACKMLNNILQEFSPATKSAAIHSVTLYQKSINILRQRIASLMPKPSPMSYISTFGVRQFIRVDASVWSTHLKFKYSSLILDPAPFSSNVPCLVPKYVIIMVDSVMITLDNVLQSLFIYLCMLHHLLVISQ